MLHWVIIKNSEKQKKKPTLIVTKCCCCCCKVCCCAFCWVPYSFWHRFFFLLFYAPIFIFSFYPRSKLYIMAITIGFTFFFVVILLCHLDCAINAFQWIKMQWQHKLGHYRYHFWISMEYCAVRVHARSIVWNGIMRRRKKNRSFEAGLVECHSSLWISGCLILPPLILAPK